LESGLHSKNFKKEGQVVFLKRYTVFHRNYHVITLIKVFLKKKRSFWSKNIYVKRKWIQ